MYTRKFQQWNSTDGAAKSLDGSKVFYLLRCLLKFLTITVKYIEYW